ncbi:integumentary mucin C.1-like [Crassostrea angulata]|uniref:integumentary mucin C.1-like n=1 Tax=Magallana angulata TaxID=2784310 RepID=UPI0022B16EC0|nr:integumentary mucin C.1-like [Crassostrea angulata]
MASTPFIFVWILLNIDLTEGLTCYQCVNIADPSACKQVAACFPGEHCLFLNNGNITMSCADDLTCASLQSRPVDVIGRRNSNGAQSHCCNHDTCNDGRFLTTTTKTPDVCVDLNDAFCGATSVHDSICSDPDLSVNWCPKTCGKCPTTTTTTTTALPCVDNQPAFCSAPGVDVVICSNLDRAVKYCQKTCNKCDVKPNTFVSLSQLPSTLYKTTAHPTTPRITTRSTTTTTTSTTTEPTTTTTTTTTTTSPPWICEDYDIAHCSDPEVKTLVCADDNLNYLCRKTCNICEH